MKCKNCDGCGQVANDDEGSPWSAWEALPPQSQLAMRMGMVKPLPCPACGGSGIVPQDAPPPQDAPTFEIWRCPAPHDGETGVLTSGSPMEQSVAEDLIRAHLEGCEGARNYVRRLKRTAESVMDMAGCTELEELHNLVAAVTFWDRIMDPPQVLPGIPPEEVDVALAMAQAPKRATLAEVPVEDTEVSDEEKRAREAELNGKRMGARDALWIMGKRLDKARNKFVTTTFNNYRRNGQLDAIDFVSGILEQMYEVADGKRQETHIEDWSL